MTGITPTQFGISQNLESSEHEASSCCSFSERPRVYSSVGVGLAGLVFVVAFLVLGTNPFGWAALGCAGLCALAFFIINREQNPEADSVSACAERKLQARCSEERAVGLSRWEQNDQEAQHRKMEAALRDPITTASGQHLRNKYAQTTYRASVFSAAIEALRKHKENRFHPECIKHLRALHDVARTYGRGNIDAKRLEDALLYVARVYPKTCSDQESVNRFMRSDGPGRVSPFDAVMNYANTSQSGSFLFDEADLQKHLSTEIPFVVPSSREVDRNELRQRLVDLVPTLFVRNGIKETEEFRLGLVLLQDVLERLGPDEYDIDLNRLKDELISCAKLHKDRNWLDPFTLEEFEQRVPGGTSALLEEATFEVDREIRVEYTVELVDSLFSEMSDLEEGESVSEQDYESDSQPMQVLYTDKQKLAGTLSQCVPLFEKDLSDGEISSDSIRAMSLLKDMVVSSHLRSLSYLDLDVFEQAIYKKLDSCCSGDERDQGFSHIAAQ